jgi:transposase-like protein
MFFSYMYIPVIKFNKSSNKIITITNKIESYNTVVKAIRIRSLSECNYTVLTLLMVV